MAELAATVHRVDQKENQAVIKKPH